METTFFERLLQLASSYSLVHHLHLPVLSSLSPIVRMNYIGKFITNFREFYNEINSATLTGAIDVVVVQQPDGSYTCSPFHVRFGKIGVLRSREKLVDIEVNGDPIDIHMKLGESGEAFFVEEVEDDDEPVPSYLATSPIPCSPDIEHELRNIQSDSEEPNQKEPSETSAFTYDDSNSAQTRCSLEVTSEIRVQISEHGSIIEKTEVKLDATEASHSDSTGPNHTVLVPTVTTRETSVQETSSQRRSFVAVSDFTPIRKDETSVAIQTDVSQGSHDSGQHSGSDQRAERSDSASTGNESKGSNSTDEYIVEEGRQRRRRRKKSQARRRPPSRDHLLSMLEREGAVCIGKWDGMPIKPEPSPARRHSKDHVSLEPEGVFQMEDDMDDYGDDDDLETSPLSRSLSMPLSQKGDKSFVGWSLRKISSSFAGEFHPFSDGELSPIGSPLSPRPPSPKSDTEFENQKHDAMSQTEGQEVSWSWGELPNVSRKTSEDRHKSQWSADDKIVSSDDEDMTMKLQKADEKQSMLGGMLNFMRSTKKIRHMAENEGVYLDDLNPDDLDPEVAALYFPKFRSEYTQPIGFKEPSAKDEDVESGNGPSLPHSPHSVEGAIGGPQSIDSDTDDRHAVFGYSNKYYSDLAMSLCGGLQHSDGSIAPERFLHSLVTYDDFCQNPSVLQNPDLVVRVGGKYLNWQTAAPLLISLATYQRPLPEKVLNQLCDQYMPKKKKKSYSSWWSWRRTAPETEDKKSTDQQLSLQQQDSEKASTPGTPDGPQQLQQLADASPSNPEPPAIQEAKITIDLESLSQTTPDVPTVLETSDIPSPVIDESPKSEQPETPSSSTASLPTAVPSNVAEHFVHAERFREDMYGYTSSENEAELGQLDEKNKAREKRRHTEKYRKVLRLNSEQIKSLNLQKGANEVVFSVTTAYQGTTRCKCHIYLWRYDDKIIISDIDGTITKSDVLGHILPIIGKDWAQSGVANLFTKIKANGYQFLYLSARAIGQAHITREYLKSVRQGDLCLPDGPLLLSPTSLISALHREVIEKKPEEFKISCLRDIQALFPSSVANPFYAGFGNKINDTWAYRAVKIPISRIFTINYRGELKLELIQTFQSSYTRLSDVVDHMFPPLHRRHSVDGLLEPSFASAEEFSSFTYWRDPLPDIPGDDQLVKKDEKTTTTSSKK